MVVILFTVSILQTAKKNLDKLWRPLSVSSFDGIPKMATLCSKMMQATAVAFVLLFQYGLRQLGVSNCHENEKLVTLLSLGQVSKYVHTDVFKIPFQEKQFKLPLFLSMFTVLRI